MEWVIVLLTICLYETSGNHALECTPGATIPHPTDCTVYYICDAESNGSMFVCPWDQLFNPVTTSCELAEKVTCFGTKKEDENTTSVSDDGHVEIVKEVGINESKQEEEPELHKQFYLVEDKSDEASDSEEQDEDNGSKKDENSQEFDSNARTSGDGEEKHEGDIDKLDENKSKNISIDSSEKSLGEESYESKETETSGTELSVQSNEQPTKSEEDNEEAKETESEQTTLFQLFSYNTTDHNSSSVDVILDVNDHEEEEEEDDDDPEDDDDDEDLLEKREADENDSITEVTESKVEEETKDGQHNQTDIEDGHQNDEHDDHSIEGGHPNVEHENQETTTINLSTIIDSSVPSPISESYNITSVDGTNLLRFGSLEEPIANWTETLDNGWTHLQIFWKHPKDEEYQGSIQLNFPTKSMSDDLDVQELVFEILKLGDEADKLSSAEINGEFPQANQNNGTETR